MPWHDGRRVDGPVPFELTDRGLTLGDGVFDTALAIGGRIAFEDAHVARLAASAEALGFSIPTDDIRAAMRALASIGRRLAIRTTATRGTGPRGLAPPVDPKPMLFATAAESARTTAFAPLRLWPTPIARNDTSPAARLKTLGYLDAVLAARDARDAGFDDAFFCNTRGRVACAGTGNLFAIFDHVLVTPPVSDGILAGIVRAEVLRLAPACGLRGRERSLTPAELGAAETVFVTNSLRLIAPVTAIGGTTFAADHPALAALAAALRAQMAAECGVSEEAVA